MCELVLLKWLRSVLILKGAWFRHPRRPEVHMRKMFVMFLHQISTRARRSGVMFDVLRSVKRNGDNMAKHSMFHDGEGEALCIVIIIW